MKNHIFTDTTKTMELSTVGRGKGNHNADNPYCERMEELTLQSLEE